MFGKPPGDDDAAAAARLVRSIISGLGQRGHSKQESPYRKATLLPPASFVTQLGGLPGVVRHASC